jgi:hypothetical protein
VSESGHVIKKLTLLVSLAAVSVGSWTLTRGHPQASTCGTNIGQLRGASGGTVCSNATSSYLIGVALTMGGMFLVTLVVIAMVKYSRTNSWGNKLPSIPRLQQLVLETLAQTQSDDISDPQTPTAIVLTQHRRVMAQAAR